MMSARFAAFTADEKAVRGHSASSSPPEMSAYAAPPPPPPPSFLDQYKKQRGQ